MHIEREIYRDREREREKEKRRKNNVCVCACACGHARFPITSGNFTMVVYWHPVKEATSGA